MQDSVITSYPKLGDYQITMLNAIFDNLYELIDKNISIVEFDWNYNDEENILSLSRSNISGLTTINLSDTSVVYLFKPHKGRKMGTIYNVYLDINDNFNMMIKCFLMDTMIITKK